jgi:hypothetical protein
MFVILEVLISCIRILLFFFGSLFTFILGESTYRVINNTLFAFAIPCMEMMSFVIAIAGPIAYFWGIHHQRSFFQRESSYNKSIFVIAFLFGVGVTFLPIATTNSLVCTEQIQLIQKILQSIMTGVIAAFISYLSFDVGVFQSLYITPVFRKSAGKQKKKR